jgi:hypothetical protein
MSTSAVPSVFRLEPAAAIDKNQDGTRSSNPVSSSGESANFRSLSAGRPAFRWPDAGKGGSVIRAQARITSNRGLTPRLEIIRFRSRSGASWAVASSSRRCHHAKDQSAPRSCRRPSIPKLTELAWMHHAACWRAVPDLVERSGSKPRAGAVGRTTTFAEPRLSVSRTVPLRAVPDE